MERNKALKLCKFYRGENECPDELEGIKSTYWSLEEGWVKLTTGDTPYNESRSNKYAFEFSLDFPDNIGYLDINFELKAAMYNRYRHWYGSKDGFVEFLSNYLATK